MNKEPYRMNMHHHLKISLAAALLVVCLFPFSALASENVVESAPEVILPEEEVKDVTPADPTYYLPSGLQYATDPNESLPTAEQFESIGITASAARQYQPSLTSRELELYDKLTADLAAGEKLPWTDQGYANKTEDVLIGVYPLDPAEFCGETYYVLLPPFQMNTEHLYSLVLAFEQLGLSFDPAALNVRNCTRGGYYAHPSTRYLSYEESERMDQILRQIHRGILKEESVVPETPCLSVETKWSPYRSVRFRFYPFRSLTDNELAAFAFPEETAWDVNPGVMEAEARDFARSVLRLPLSMTSTDEKMDPSLVDSRAYMFSFQFIYGDAETGGLAEKKPEDPLDLTVWQYLLREDDGSTSQWFNLSLYYTYSSEVADEHPGYTEEDWIAAARKWAAESLVLPEDRMPDDWHIADMSGGTVILTAKKAGWTFRLALNIKDTCPEYFETYQEDET